MDAELERRIALRAGELAALLDAGDAAAVEPLCDPSFWERAGHEELPELLEDVDAVRVLGVLGRRSLISLVPRSVIESQWLDRGGELLLEDQREFTLLDRVSLVGADAERLDRVRTKRRSEDAAQRYVAALEERDEVAAGAFFEPAFARAADVDLLERLPFLRAAELIGSVGPRTLVRLELEGGEQTVEYLWRDHEGSLAIVGARTFRRLD
jgi:hypothetical protein